MMMINAKRMFISLGQDRLDLSNVSPPVPWLVSSIDEAPCYALLRVRDGAKSAAPRI